MIFAKVFHCDSVTKEEFNGRVMYKYKKGDDYVYSTVELPLSLQCQMFQKDKNVNLRASRLAEVIKDLTDIDIFNKSRALYESTLRYMAMYQLYEEGYSESQIGRAFDMNHSTVHYGLKKYKSMLECPNMWKDLLECRTKFIEII